MGIESSSCAWWQNSGQELIQIDGIPLVLLCWRRERWLLGVHVPCWDRTKGMALSVINMMDFHPKSSKTGMSTGIQAVNIAW